MNSTAQTHDVLIVGDGPAGCSAGVCTAREGLDTVIFDRERSSYCRTENLERISAPGGPNIFTNFCPAVSLANCAYLENYLGFPAGIDIETVSALFHDHATRAGCTIRSDLVETIDRDDDKYTIEPQDGKAVTARRVIAATRYDRSYFRGLDDDEAIRAYMSERRVEGSA